MTIIIPELWLWLACGAMTISIGLNVVSIRQHRENIKLLKEKQRENIGE